MPDAPGITNRRVDQFAADLYSRTARSDAEALGITGDDLESFQLVPWEKATPVLHEIFRARAIRMLNGDLSVLPPTWPIGMASD
jgi:hypothetical protein